MLGLQPDAMFAVLGSAGPVEKELFTLQMVCKINNKYSTLMERTVLIGLKKQPFSSRKCFL